MNVSEMSEDLDMLSFQVNCLTGRISEKQRQTLLGMIDTSDGVLVRFRETSNELFIPQYLTETERLIKLIDSYAIK